MKIAAATASAVLFTAPVVLAVPAQADPASGCSEITGRLSICPEGLHPPDGYRCTTWDKATGNCLPPCNLIDIQGKVYPQDNRPCSDAGEIHKP